MAVFESSPVISAIQRIPRKREYLVRLSDGSELKALDDDLGRFGLVVGACLDRATIEEMGLAYAYGKARQAALRLLRVRPRTEGELRGRLRRGGTAGQVSDQLIKDLKAEGLLDDRLFAELWIKEEVVRGSHGKRRVRRDLEVKGIEPDILEQELAKHYGDAAELEIARRVGAQKASRLAGLGVPDRRERVYQHLLRRGFEAGVAAEATRWALGSAEGESSL
jgi:regulatory protein